MVQQKNMLWTFHKLLHLLQYFCDDDKATRLPTAFKPCFSYSTLLSEAQDTVWIDVIWHGSDEILGI